MKVLFGDIQSRCQVYAYFANLLGGSSMLDIPNKLGVEYTICNMFLWFYVTKLVSLLQDVQLFFYCLQYLRCMKTV